MDLQSGRIDVKLAIDVDLDKLCGKIGADQSTHVASSYAPVSPKKPPPSSQPPSLNGGVSGSEGFRPDLEQRNTGSKYVPPPARVVVFRNTSGIMKKLKRHVQVKQQ
ncbi:hypothetical protein ZWY2020_026068 [Hordeum vulgare]|nr:hypothetical protein ZWY2020_026068 [Hordeum vulgare]